MIWEIRSVMGNGISGHIGNKISSIWGGLVLMLFLFLCLQLNLLHTYVRQSKVSSENVIDWTISDINSTTNITFIQQKILEYNQKQIIYNRNNFENLRSDSIIIVVQVHTRISYLRNLIDSLAQASNISEVLVIFSHDYYDEEINDLIQNIDFCKVLQIFFPYSIQTNPEKFPGNDPLDCPRNINKEQALIQKCKNALDPDMYGHYREAKFTQIKHHWWWKANRVFNQLDATKGHEGLVLFLEEDHYVTEDVIHVLKLMNVSSKESCPHCNIFSLGTYSKKNNFQTNSAKVQISPWTGNKHNMGIAFNRSTWMNILECSNTFCKYDDYNWDWSLQYTSNNCLKEKLYVMFTVATRVFHTGTCGVHHQKSQQKKCDPTTLISKISEDLKLARKYLYPNKLITSELKVKGRGKIKPNGGWGDKRDQKLCITMTRLSEY